MSELGIANPAIDELNCRIDVLFREHGIEIAFNQMDVYIKNMQETNRRWNPAWRCRRRGTSPGLIPPVCTGPVTGLFFSAFWRL